MATRSNKAADKKKRQRSLDSQVDAYVALLKKKEPLHPDLRPCLEITRQGQIVRHPLICDFIGDGTHCAVINRRYESAREAIAEARAKGDWATYFELHVTGFRIRAFYTLFADGFGECSERLSDADYWSLLGSVYIGAEYPFDSNGQLIHLLRSSRPQRECLMEANEKAVLRKLPNTITVYRGYAHKNAHGWSWTLDKDKAVWFAKRPHNGRPRLRTGGVEKRYVLAYFNRREEEEILVEPTAVNVVSEVSV